MASLPIHIMRSDTAAAAATPRAGSLTVPSAFSSRPSLEALRQRPKQAGQASFFYFDSHFQYDAVKVLPGEYFVSGDELVITTVLGSCIAACLWDTHMRVGGMNHFLLPDSDAPDVTGRYGSYAMELLINELLKRGARRENLQAKIFGGRRSCTVSRR